MQIEGNPSPHKRYQVFRDGEPGPVLASFDTMDEALAHVGTSRKDWRHRANLVFSKNVVRSGP
jgi:hypothetical protein